MFCIPSVYCNNFLYSVEIKKPLFYYSYDVFHLLLWRFSTLGTAGFAVTDTVLSFSPS